MKAHFKESFRIIPVLLILSACSSEQIKDHVAYGDEGKFGAVAVHTLFTKIKPAHIEKGEWDRLRVGMVCLGANDVNDIQKTIDDLCTKHSGACSYDVLRAADRAFTNLKQNMAADYIPQ
jgi:hypothetical protein